MFPKQAIILCGGLGTRLGALTTDTPKPLLAIGGVPFLEILIREIGRSGIRDFLLLAGHLGHQVQDFAASMQERLGSGYSIAVNVEREPAGTGGALFEVRNQLSDPFILLNGDSYLDFPLHELASAAMAPNRLGAIALRRVPDVSRFGQVHLDGDTIYSFEEKSSGERSGAINGGVYFLRKEALASLGPRSSLERDLFPILAEQRKLGGKVFDTFFIDIGLPETYEEAGKILMEHRRRPAAFLDRDGVLNRDVGHVGTSERWEWTEGAVDAVRRLNRAGYYVFVVTNQAGIAKGKYGLDEYWGLRDIIREELFAQHAQIDDECFCPYHPDATVDQWRAASAWRKPEPGMINHLSTVWPVDKDASFLIGDQQSDLVAAANAGIRSHLFSRGNLDHFVEALL